MKYFGKVYPQTHGSEIRGVFRRPYPDDYRVEEAFIVTRRRWEPSVFLREVLVDGVDGDVIEISEAQARDYVAGYVDAAELDSVMAAPPPPRPAVPLVTRDSYFSRDLSGATHYVPIAGADEGQDFGLLWWAEDDSAAAALPNPRLPDGLGLLATLTWNERLREAKERGLTPGQAIAGLPVTLGPASGWLDYSRQSRVRDREELLRAATWS